MTTRSRPCPSCGDQLVRGHRSELNTWECPDGHGVGIFLIDAWGTLQRDELEALWDNSKTAPHSELRSPISGEPMLEVTFHVDEDMRMVDDSPNTEMVVEVDPDNYFGWFQIEELDAMPKDSEKRGPRAPGMVGLDQMDDHRSQNERLFADMDSGHFDEEPVRNNLFSGLAGRLRQR